MIQSKRPLPIFIYFYFNLHGKYARLDKNNGKQGRAKGVIIVQFANKKSIVNSYELIMEINFGYLTLESFLPAVASVLTDAPRVTKRRSNPQNLCSRKEEKLNAPWWKSFPFDFGRAVGANIISLR